VGAGPLTPTEFRGGVAESPSAGAPLWWSA